MLMHISDFIFVITYEMNAQSMGTDATSVLPSGRRATTYQKLNDV